MFSKGGAVAVFDREGEYDQLIAFIKEKDLDGKFVYQSPTQWQGRLKRTDNEKVKTNVWMDKRRKTLLGRYGVDCPSEFTKRIFSIYKYI